MKTFCLAFSLLWFSTPLFSAPLPSQKLSKPAPTPPIRSSKVIQKELLSDLGSRKSIQFDPLLKKWEARYGTHAVPSLLQIAQNPRAKDPDRYIAVMASARLGGKKIAPQLTPLLRAQSWMVRSATLKALRALQANPQGKAVLPLLQDKALVVRNEAVRTLTALKPKGAVSALVKAAKDPSNFHGGRAMWVPQEALKGLVQMGAPQSIAKDLKPLLNQVKDGDFIRLTVKTLEQITGKKLGEGRSLQAQVRLWQKALN